MREKIKLPFKQCSKCGHKPGQASEDYPCKHTWVGGDVDEDKESHGK
jgi:hypothetical protein